MPEYRQNPLTGQYVILSPERADRPNALPARQHQSRPAHDPECPFCPGQERQTPPEVFAYRFDGSAPDSAGWSVRTFLNKFPAVTLEAAGVPTPESIAFAPAAAPALPAPAGSALHPREPAVGQHEVLVESPAHDVTFAHQGERQTRLIIDALRHRFRVLMQARDVKHVTVFQNHGDAAAATIAHPHWQLLATAVVPPAAANAMDRQEAYAKQHGRPLFAALLEQELELGRRVIAANDEFVALAPWASKAAYETWLVPREPIPFFGELSDEAVPLLAALLRDALHRLDVVLGDPAYNVIIHSGPRLLRAADHCRMYVQILPRLHGFGGVELGAGMFINHMPPETAASELRGQ